MNFVSLRIPFSTIPSIIVAALVLFRRISIGTLLIFAFPLHGRLICVCRRRQRLRVELCPDGLGGRDLGLLLAPTHPLRVEIVEATAPDKRLHVSGALFIATANVSHPIPPALKSAVDRPLRDSTTANTATAKDIHHKRKSNRNLLLVALSACTVLVALAAVGWLYGPQAKAPFAQLSS